MPIYKKPAGNSSEWRTVTPTEHLCEEILKLEKEQLEILKKIEAKMDENSETDGDLSTMLNQIFHRD